MKHQAAYRSILDILQAPLREPAGLVCVTLSLALVTVLTRIATHW